MIARNASPFLTELSRHFPVLFLTGPRQSGKTTLVRALFPDLPYVLLEFPDQRRLALEDPRSFLAQYPLGAILDEVQHVPDLFSYLQGLVDENRNVKFVLTGSQNFLLNEKISQSLAGRAGVASLLPLTLRELSDTVAATSFEQFIYKGFYPEIYNRNVPPAFFYPSYVQTYLERDVRSLQHVGNLAQFNVFLKLCAGRIGQIVNVSALAIEAGVSVNTARTWLSVMEASYIIYRLQPHYRNYNKRLIKSPKLYFIDTGLACYLLGIQNASQLITHYAFGSLFENFVVMEIYKQRLNKGKRDGLYFWRDNKGVEIDLMVEDGDSLKSFEIKASRTMNSEYFKNLSYWSKLSGQDKNDCAVIYGGEISQSSQQGRIIRWRDITTDGIDS